MDLEERLDYVVNPKTREYLKEVISSYYNGNYRSCIVVLYTIVLFDFVQKIKTLWEIYEIKSAETLMKDIEKDYKTPEIHFSKIEKKIIDYIISTHLMSPLEEKQFQFLKEQRHHTAHLVLIEDCFQSPSREQTKMHISNMLTAVFTKDTLNVDISIIENFRTSIAEYYNRQCELIGFDRFLRTRWYSKFNTLTRLNVFRKLWGYNFFFNDEDCLKNAPALLAALTLLVSENKTELIDFFHKNVDFFTIKLKPEKCKFEWSDITNYYNSCSKRLILFFKEMPEFYSLMPDYIQIQIKDICKSDLTLYLQSNFLYNDYTTHLLNIKKHLINNNIKTACIDPIIFFREYNYAKTQGFCTDFFAFVSFYFCHSVFLKDSSLLDFKHMASLYKNLLQHILPDYTFNEIHSLLTNLKNNDIIKYLKRADFYSNFREQIEYILKFNHDNTELIDNYLPHF